MKSRRPRGRWLWMFRQEVIDSPGGPAVKNLPACAEDTDSTPALGRLLLLQTS